MGYLRFRQICLVAPKLRPVADDLSAILGQCVCFRDPAVGKYGLKNALWPIGDQFLEIVAPIEPNTAAGRFLERSNGKGGYMAIFDCNDPHARGAHCERLGVRKIADHSFGDYTGVQLHPRDCRAAMIEFNATKGGDADPDLYAPAGSHWKEFAGGPTRIAHVIMEGAPDLGAHWAKLFQQPLRSKAGKPCIAFPEADLFFEEAARESLAELAIQSTRSHDPIAIARRRGYEIVEGAIEIAGVRLRAI
jgi:hypothetical protein